MTLEFVVFSVAIDNGAVVVECGRMYDISTFRQRNCTREENKSCARMYACTYVYTYLQYVCKYSCVHVCTYVLTYKQERKR